MTRARHRSTSKRRVAALVAAAFAVLALGGLLATAVDAPPPGATAGAQMPGSRPVAAAAPGTAWDVTAPRRAAERPGRKQSPTALGIPADVHLLATQRPFVATPEVTRAPTPDPGTVPPPARRTP